jgi:hypothetical protein
MQPPLATSPATAQENEAKAAEFGAWLKSVGIDPVTGRRTLVFSNDPSVEHATIQRLNVSRIIEAHELGERVFRFRKTGRWRDVRVDPQFEDFPDYIQRGLRLGLATAYKYIAVSTFPVKMCLSYGIERMSWLKKITDLTAVEETPEQAVALELPVRGGGVKPFRDMTAEEVEIAYRLMRDEQRKAKRGPVGVQSVTDDGVDVRLDF